MDQKRKITKEQMVSFLKKKGNWLWILGLIGIVLIGLSSFGGEDNDTVINTSAGQDTIEFETQLEQRLETMVTAINGAGACQIMVTLEQGTEYIYATQEKNTVDTSQTSESSRYTTGNRSSDEETYIMVSTDQGEQPVLLTALAPRVKGVVVVCQGGDQPGVCEKIRTALATVLNINSARICVVAGNSQ